MWMALMMACWVSSKDNSTEQIDDTNQSDTADTSDTLEPTDTGEPQDTNDGVTVRIEGLPIYIYSTASCTVEGAQGGVYFQWLLDDSHIGVQSNVIDMSAFSEDQPSQTLTCEALSTDTNEIIGKDSIVIANQPPSDLQISISPSGPRAGQDDVTCEATASDNDGQTLTISYEWTDGASTLIASDVLPASETSEGETWDCTATASDGIDTVTHAEGVTITAPSGCGFGDCDLSISLGNGQVADFIQISAGTSPTGTYSISNDYYIMTTEVTQGMFNALMDYQSHSGMPQTYGVGDDYPANYASWHMAAAFANAMTNQYNSQMGTALDECYNCSGNNAAVQCSETMNPYNCTGFVLPTRARWEYAARSGTAENYWTPDGGGPLSLDDCGDGINGTTAQITDDTANPPLVTYAWFCANRHDTNYTDTSKPVALKVPNGFGLYDMPGNIAEWVADIDGCSMVGVDPVYCGTVSTDRVFMGGSWTSYPSQLTLDGYAIGDPLQRNAEIGFRLVRLY